MSFSGFTDDDFDVFKIDGLEPRMEAIQSEIQPKFQTLGDLFEEELSRKTGMPITTHIARHARRTVNPPSDTWVAFAANKRGYKKHPHFQIGLWESHIFIWFVIMEESDMKPVIAGNFSKNRNELFESVPEDFYWSTDHTKPHVIPRSDTALKDFEGYLKRLRDVKKAELLCGRIIPREQAVVMSGTAFIDTARGTFDTLMPFYELACDPVNI